MYNAGMHTFLVRSIIAVVPIIIGQQQKKAKVQGPAAVRQKFAVFSEGLSFLPFFVRLSSFFLVRRFFPPVRRFQFFDANRCIIN